jgi:mRNA interferase HigB
VRIISITRLKEFWEARKGDSELAERDLSAWIKLAKNADWANFGELKQTFGSADQVGNCVVFDVGNNRFRLIGRVFYVKDLREGRIYVLKVMDHKEYDKGAWIDGCGCYKPPPPKKPAAARNQGRKRRRR